VPTQIVRLLRLPEAVRARFDTSSLQVVWHGAAPCPRWAKEQLIDWFGLVVWEYFGSTEGTGPFLCDSLSFLERPGTIGQPPAHLTPVVLDEHGRPARPGQIGELWFRSEWGPPAYHNDEDKTRSIRRPDGLFTAGDFGWIDDDGYVFIADRRVDLILSGGVNIYPAEIEAALTEHPAVRDAAAIGLPDDEWGQSVHAVVEVAPGSDLRPDELDAFVRQRLAGFKCPKSYRFVDALPRDEAGKLRRHQLRQIEPAAELTEQS
jgi:long-chain acyl-CoA synthetase